MLCLVQRPLGQRPRSGQGWPAAWGGHKRHQKPTSARSRQMNVFIYLSFPQNLPTNSIYCPAWNKTKRKYWKGGGCGGRGPLAPEILAPFLGPSVQFHNTYTTNFQNWSCLVFWFFLCLCICALKVPSKWILIVRAAHCWLLQCPRAPRTCFSKP